MKRKIVKIDEAKCTGCGECIPKCAEGALAIVDGKAKLISERYCDGLGACLGECPQGAITIEEREAEEFDEEAVKEHLERKEEEREVLQACPSTHTMVLAPEAKVEKGRASSMLAQWPVKLALVNPKAPYFQNADLILVADCVPFAYANFHQDFLKGKAIVIGCPKLDDARFYLQKLTGILRSSKVKSVTVVNMEVPCCNALWSIAQKAIAESGKKIPLRQTVIGIDGEIKGKK